MPKLGEQYRYYTVVVNNGSGCIFQPDSEDFTYILTVKHNLILDTNGNPYLDYIKVSRTYQDYLVNDHIEIMNCFVHKTLDYALIKVPKLENDNKNNLIIGKLDINMLVEISGFPQYMRDEPVENNPEYRTSLKARIELDRTQINEFDATPPIAVNTFDTGAAFNISGFSGSGVFVDYKNEIHIVGIFPKINDSNATHNKIVVFDLSGFHDIIEENKLPKLLPFYMSSFKHLQDLIFQANISSIDLTVFESIVIQIKNFGSNIFDSDIIPLRIYEDFKSQIFICARDESSMSNQKLWLGFLEYLLISKITLDYPIEYSEIEKLCNKIRFKFSNSEKEWTSLLDTEIANSNYKGLKSGSKIVIQTNMPCSNRTIIKANEIPGVINRVDTTKLQISEGITNPFTDFDFIHIDYFLNKCIVDSLSSFTIADTPDDIINKLLKSFKEILG